MNLIPLDQFPAEAPEWAVYGFAQALRLNRNVKLALAFINERASTPALVAIKGELLLAETNRTEATRLYTALASESAEARAYLARTAFAAKDYPTARRYTEELIALFPDELQLRSNLDEILKAEAPRQ